MPYYLGLSILSNKQTRGKQSRELLRAEARSVLFRLAGRRFGEDEIAREENGRPYFRNFGADFNISHSGRAAAVSLAEGGNCRTGCDIQAFQHRKGAAKIADDFFRPPEREWVFADGEFDESKFYAIWALKECYLKLRGLPVFAMKKVPSFIESPRAGRYDFSFGAPVSFPVSFYLYELDDGNGERYSLASALEGPIPEGPRGRDLPPETGPPELRWFSQGSFFCRKIAKIKAAPSPADTVSPKI